MKPASLIVWVALVVLSLAPSATAAAAARAADEGSLLPSHRILTYYGHPGTTGMGILGEYDKDTIRQKLADQAAEYKAVDPSRPIKLAFEVIFSVAQPVPGADGTFLVNTDGDTIQEYADYAAAHDMLLFLDVQIGRNGVKNEIANVRKWLELPQVHLALDPEFAMDAGQIPGQEFGHLDAKDVTLAQETLADLVAAKGIPPKVLIVHQFRYDMLTNKDRIKPVKDVQLVIDEDGFGPPNEKQDSYRVINTEQPIEFNAIKLFYEQDKPLMSAADVLALEPSPDVIIYQ